MEQPIVEQKPSGQPHVVVPPPPPFVETASGKPALPFVPMAMAGELAYIIAIPAVVFGIGGAYLDKYVGTSPLFLTIGFSLAFLTSSIGAARIIKRLTDAAEREAALAKKAHSPENPKS